jgi:hypothetical protein
LIVFTLLVLADLVFVPTLALWVIMGSLLTTAGAPFLPSVLVSAALGVGLLALTFWVGRAWRRAPRLRPAGG